MLKKIVFIAFIVLLLAFFVFVSEIQISNSYYDFFSNDSRIHFSQDYDEKNVFFEESNFTGYTLSGNDRLSILQMPKLIS